LTRLLSAPARPPRGLLRITGEDRATFLQGLVSNDVLAVGERHGIWAALLTPQGKYLHDFFVVGQGEALLIDGEGARIADLKRRLSMFRLRAKVAVDDVGEGFEVWHGWGGGALDAFDLAEPGAARPVGDAFVLADPRLPALGIRLIAPKGRGGALLAERGFSAGDWADWDLLRLSLGVPDGSRDLVAEKSILLESGFDELNGVSWTKGCYMGQELTARTKYRGLVKKRLMPVRIDGPLPSPGTPVMKDGAEAGEIRSGQDQTALALIRLDALDAPLTAGEARIIPLRPDWARW